MMNISSPIIYWYGVSSVTLAIFNYSLVTGENG